MFSKVTVPERHKKKLKNLMFQILTVSVNDVSRNSEWVVAAKLANHDARLKDGMGAQANLPPHTLFVKLGKKAITRP